MVEKKLLPYLAEETGWHLGDGSMNIYKGKGLYQLRGHWLDDRHHYDNTIMPIFENLYGVKINLRDMPCSGVYGFQVWSDSVVASKIELGLPLGPKGECSIPDCFCKDDNVLSVIRGIFDTDGTLFIENKRGKPYPRIEIKQTSSVLAQQIHSALLKHGIISTYHVEKRSCPRWKPLHVVSVRGKDMLRRWMAEIKPRNLKHTNKAIDVLNLAEQVKAYI